MKGSSLPCDMEGGGTKHLFIVFFPNVSQGQPWLVQALATSLCRVSKQTASLSNWYLPLMSILK